MSYTILQKFITKNRPYTPLSAKGGVIHETANPGDSDEMEASYFANNNVSASAHAFIDADSITQLIPWNEVAWHAGRTANRQFWGLEMCHTSDPVKFAEIWKRATWLYAYLFIKEAFPRITKVSPINLMSHAEVSEKWRETDHMDPVSYFAEFGKTVDMFRSDVQAQIDTMLFSAAVNNRGLCSVPDYWKDNANACCLINGAYMRQLILNFVAMFKRCDTFEQTLDYLLANKIIADKNYWLLNAVEGKKVKGKYARIVLIGMGRYLI